MARKISSQCGMGFRTKYRPKGAFCCSFVLQLCIIMATIGLASCQTQNRSIGNGFKSLSVSAYEKAISRKTWCALMSARLQNLPKDTSRML